MAVRGLAQSSCVAPSGVRGAACSLCVLLSNGREVKTDAVWTQPSSCPGGLLLAALRPRLWQWWSSRGGVLRHGSAGPVADEGLSGLCARALAGGAVYIYR